MSSYKDVHWNTSPACSRFLEFLECRGDASPNILAAKCHASIKYAYNMLTLLKVAGVVHICAWRHNRNGSPTPIYRLGPGVNKSLPTAETTAQRCKKRRDSLVSLFGVSQANTILGTSRVKGRFVMDGKNIRTKDHDAHLAGKISA